MLLVQEFLKKHTFRELQVQHGVYASVAKGGRKFSLNYDQIEAKENDPLAQECRGLILAPADGKPLYCEVTTDGKRHYEDVGPGETVVLAYPMKRFFNHGQGSAANINWSDPKLAVLEKLDGTLCIVYYDPFTKQWCVATRSVSEADLLMDNGLFTFRTLFEKAFEETTGYSFNGPVGDLNHNYTYCFELTTPYNRIVVNYPHNRVTLLAVRNMQTLEEEDPRQLMKRDLIPNMPIVQVHPHTTLPELLDWVSSLNPMEHEGVVVRDGQYNRIKVKNAAYVAYNKVRDTLATSARNCVELILAEKDDDVIPFLPEEIVNNLKKIKAGLVQAIREHDAAYLAAKAEADAILPNDKKTFAILVTKNNELWTAPFFHRFDGKSVSTLDFIVKNRKDGSWGDSFLDRLLEMSKKFTG
jgi:hypothetical protein